MAMSKMLFPNKEIELAAKKLRKMPFLAIKDLDLDVMVNKGKVES
jgi:hypothetical protein